MSLLFISRHISYHVEAWRVVSEASHHPCVLSTMYAASPVLQGSGCCRTDLQPCWSKPRATPRTVHGRATCSAALTRWWWDLMAASSRGCSVRCARP